MNFGVIDLFMIFIITLGPLKSSIVYVTLTAEADAGFRRRVAIKTVVTSTTVAVLFVFAGELMLKAFHVSIPALKLAGGLILILFALEMVIGSKSKEDASADTPASTDIGVYPLAMPLMATPQGLVAIVTVSAATPGTQEVLLVIGLILAIMAFNFIFFARRPSHPQSDRAIGAQCGGAHRGIAAGGAGGSVDDMGPYRSGGTGETSSSGLTRHL